MTRILIADDHPIVRRGLKQILAEESDICEIGEARTGQEVLQQLRGQIWDAVVLDVNLPDRSGLDILREIRERNPRLPVLILSMHPEDQFAVRVVKAGASGYLTKDSAAEELVKALRRILSGGKYISPTLAEQLAEALTGETEKPAHEKLTDREYLVLCRIGSGRTVSEIAEELQLSVKTVSTYRTRILEKMDLRTNAELTSYAVRNGLVK
jgi:two-component system, NarL family, invasion response regulator UvrY